MMNYIFYLVLIENKKAEKTLIEDLSKEIYEDYDITAQELSTFFLSCKSLFQTTSFVTHLDDSNVRKATKEILKIVLNKNLQETVEIIREWVAQKNPEKHLALSGIAYTGIRKALKPKKLILCPVVESENFGTNPKLFSKVSISNGWVREIDSGDSCPLLGCIPYGNGYFAWRLYPENTAAPILGFFDFCRNTKNLPILQNWISIYSDNPVGKILEALYHIEEIEIFRDALFI